MYLQLFFLFTLFVFVAYSGFQHMLCCVFALFVVVLCVLCCQFHWLSIFDCPLFKLFVFVCAQWCPTHIVLCCVFVLLVFILCILYMLPVSFHCRFVTAPSVFSNVYLWFGKKNYSNEMKNSQNIPLSEHFQNLIQLILEIYFFIFNIIYIQFCYACSTKRPNFHIYHTVRTFSKSNRQINLTFFFYFLAIIYMYIHFCDARSAKRPNIAISMKSSF